MLEHKRNRTILSIFAILTILTLCTVPNFAKAAQGFDMELNYTGDVIENTAKQVDAVLNGTGATVYTNARIDITITGPATPTLIATDSLGVDIDMAQTGYWGPPGGFAVGGNFQNVTPIRATFPMAGGYTIKLSLVDMNSGGALISEEEFDVNVKGNDPSMQYEFMLEAAGDYMVNEEKAGELVLKATNAISYSNVRIKVDIEGPAMPVMYATDGTGTKYDIASLGYWGDASRIPCRRRF